MCVIEPLLKAPRSIADLPHRQGARRMPAVLVMVS